MIIAVAKPLPSGIVGSSCVNVSLEDRHTLAGAYGPRDMTPLAVATKICNTEPGVKFEPVSVSGPPMTIGCVIGSRTGGPGGVVVTVLARQVAPLSTGVI